jgi:hypothetical protein
MPGFILSKKDEHSFSEKSFRSFNISSKVKSPGEFGRVVNLKSRMIP